MKIAIGTKSESKVNKVKDILQLFKINDYELGCYSVNSEVSEQPMSLTETIQGAKNRAFNATKAQTKTDLSFGIEGGLEFCKNNKRCNYVCVAAIYYKEQFFVGIGSQLQIHDQVYQQLKNGNDLSTCLSQYTPKNHNEQILKDMILSREEMFFEALRNAFIQTDL